MGDRYSFRLDNQQEDILEEIIDTEECNQTEAAKRAINAGGETLGYGDVGQPRTRLRGIIQRSTDGFALAAIVWVGLTLVAPVGYRALAIPLFGIALALHGLDKAIAAYEPHLSHRLAAMITLGGGDA